jgi:hypothetical protein
VDGVGVARVFAVAGSGGTTAAAAKDVDELEGAATRCGAHVPVNPLQSRGSMGSRTYCTVGVSLNTSRSMTLQRKRSSTGTTVSHNKGRPQPSLIPERNR